MRILHVIPSFAPRYGGPIFAAVSLTRELARRGHDVTVATTNVDGPGELDVPLDRPVPMDGVDVWYFPIQRPRWYHFSAPMGRTLSGWYASPTWSTYTPSSSGRRPSRRSGAADRRPIRGARDRLSRPSLAIQAVRGPARIDRQQGQEMDLSQDAWQPGPGRRGSPPPHLRGRVGVGPPPALLKWAPHSARRRPTSASRGRRPGLSPAEIRESSRSEDRPVLFAARPQEGPRRACGGCRVVGREQGRLLAGRRGQWRARV